MRSESPVVALAGMLVLFSAAVFFVIGWVYNLLAVITAAKAGTTITALLALRAIGVVVPFLGAILGWLV